MVAKQLGLNNDPFIDFGNSTNNVVRLPLVNAADLCKEPLEPREWHVEGFIPRHTVSQLSGDGGDGKSLLMLQLAVSTALGENWIGLPVQCPGPVLYLSAEDDLKELRRRLAGILDAYGCDSEPSNLTLAPLAGMNAVLAIESRNNTIEGTPLWIELQNTIADLKPTLVIIDNLADVFSGNENSRPQARQFVNMLRGEAIKHEMSVLLLSHPSLTGINSGSGMSGSTAWNNSVRSRLYLERVFIDKIEADSDVRRLTSKKTNYSKKGEMIMLRWKDWVFVRDDIANDSPATLGAQSVQMQAERVFLELLGRYCEQGRYVNSSGGTTYAPTAFARDPDAKGISKAAFRNAMNKLFRDKKIKTVEFGPPSKRRSRIEVVGTFAKDDSEKPNPEKESTSKEESKPPMKKAA